MVGLTFEQFCGKSVKNTVLLLAVNRFLVGTSIASTIKRFLFISCGKKSNHMLLGDHML